MPCDPSPSPFTGPPRTPGPEARVFRERERHAAFSLRGVESVKRSSPRARAWGRGKGVPR